MFEQMQTFMRIKKYSKYSLTTIKKALPNKNDQYLTKSVPKKEKSAENDAKCVEKLIKMTLKQKETQFQRSREE